MGLLSGFWRKLFSGVSGPDKAEISKAAAHDTNNSGVNRVFGNTDGDPKLHGDQGVVQSEWNLGLEMFYNREKGQLQEMRSLGETLDNGILSRSDRDINVVEALELAERVRAIRLRFDEFSGILNVRDEIQSQISGRNVNEARKIGVEFGRVEMDILKKLGEQVNPIQRLDFSAGLRNMGWGDAVCDTVSQNMFRERQDDGFLPSKGRDLGL